MEIRWLSSALADLEAIQDYLADQSPTAAVSLVTTLREAASRLGEMPNRGRPGRWPGTRELVIPNLPYIIPYRVRGTVIEILRVFHGARSWPEAHPK